MSWWEGTFLTPLGCSSVRKNHFHQPSFKKINSGSCQKHHDSGENKEVWKFDINSPQLSRKPPTCKSHALDKLLLPLRKGPPSPREPQGSPGAVWEPQALGNAPSASQPHPTPSLATLKCKASLPPRAQVDFGTVCGQPVSPGVIAGPATAVQQLTTSANC